ncbi:hypothetical protein SRHO_G00109140 [Serrasalmus rhombeus]
MLLPAPSHLPPHPHRLSEVYYKKETSTIIELVANGEQRHLSVEPKGKAEQSIYKIPIQVLCVERSASADRAEETAVFLVDLLSLSVFTTSSVCTASSVREKRLHKAAVAFKRRPCSGNF